jgi:murein DD-endopeptidase MepM/ murein hydrolase activator NlpD
MTVPLYPPKYITVPQAESYASHAGFSNVLVKGTSYTQIQVIVAIAVAESSLNIYAYNPLDPYGGSYGVLQINGVHFNNNLTIQDAYNPQKAFNYAYQLSERGTNFNPWGTYTNGSWKQHIPIIQQSGSTLPSDGWWNFRRIDNIGMPDPFGGFPKPDSNIMTPDGYPIANILPGVVSGINNPNGTIPDFGATVTIKLDTPINNLATHIAFLHLQDVTVRVGQKVYPGDIVAHAGGNKAAGAQKVQLGFALYHGDYYGVDGWQYMTKENLLSKLNPVPVIESITSGNILLSSAFGDSLGSQSAAGMKFVQDAILKASTKVKLKPDEDVVATLVYLDGLLQVQNPFDVTQNDNNPLNWLGDFLYVAFVVDLVALTLRLLLFALGAYILFKVMNRYINLNTIVIGRTDGQTGNSL